MILDRSVMLSISSMTMLYIILHWEILISLLLCCCAVWFCICICVWLEQDWQNLRKWKGRAGMFSDPWGRCTSGNPKSHLWECRVGPCTVLWWAFGSRCWVGIQLWIWRSDQLWGGDGDWTDYWTIHSLIIHPSLYQSTSGVMGRFNTSMEYCL